MKTQEPEILGFELSVSARNDGTIEAAYISVSREDVAETKEVMEDILLADYDANGNLVGIEILAPVKISKLTSLVEQPKRSPFRRFVQRSAPKDLVLN